MSDNTSVATTNQACPGQPSRPAPSVPQNALAPAVDITESESGITLLADMPGVSKDRLTLTVEGENLTIEGRAQIDVPENIELLHSEVRSPYFRRAFTLSRDLDPGKIEATLRNGVLKMHIPKSEEARPKRIEVKVA
jgi:HSP20 family molecular chaperone IbpA